MKLTQKMVNAARPPQQGQAFLRDTELRGFALRTTTRGTKTYVLEKKIDGRVRRLSLGPASALTVEQARDLAKIKIGEIANGRDPAEERRAKQHSVTFHELERLYIDRHLVHNKSKRDDIGRLDNHLAFLRPRRLSDITRAELAALHADLGAAGHRVGANAMLALVSSMMNRATEWGLFTGVNPASGIKRFKTASRSRFVSPAELPKLWAAMQREPNPYVRDGRKCSPCAGRTLTLNSRFGRSLSPRPTGHIMFPFRVWSWRN
jgi:Arm DNA-binding domain